MKSVLGALQSAFNAIMDVVLPRRERTVRTQLRAPEDLPVSPIEQRMNGRQIMTLLDYRDRIIEDLIRTLKYEGSEHAAQLCATTLSDFLREEISSRRQFSRRKILLVPIPLHKSRKRERGFNQIEIVLKRLPQEFRDGTLATLSPGALRRIRATEQQTRLSRDERIKNVSGAFQVLDGDSVRGAHIFLIDDVVTTGATLVNAARPLESLGAAVSLLALARA